MIETSKLMGALFFGLYLACCAFGGLCISRPRLFRYFALGAAMSAVGSSVVEAYDGDIESMIVYLILAAMFFWLWWRFGGGDDFRKRRRKLGAKLRAKFRAIKAWRPPVLAPPIPVGR